MPPAAGLVGVDALDAVTFELAEAEVGATGCTVVVLAVVVLAVVVLLLAQAARLSKSPTAILCRMLIIRIGDVLP